VDSYRRYVQTSKAEWSVAKNGYVRGQAGWFSCRSACYLAAGRPVVVQDTGFGAALPVGEGILPFRTLEDAAEAIRAVEGDYVRHAKAARAIAEEYFDSDRVLSRLLEEASSS
jgi:glycosyltransferase involved in cell wall biosynthesis